MAGKWGHYLRCDECGVDAGKACRGDNDEAAVESCAGRRKSAHYYAQLGPCAECGVPARRVCRTPDDKPAPAPCGPRAVLRRVPRPKKYAPCGWCGVSTRLQGWALRTGETWCASPECQAAKRAEQHRRARAAGKERKRRVRERNRAERPPQAPCPVCGGEIPASQRHHLQVYCGDVCRQKAKRAKRTRGAAKGMMR